MDKQELQNAAKPFGWGLAAGVVALLIVGFGFDIVVFSSSAAEARAEAVEDATVAQLATLCEEQVRIHRATLENPADLSGWGNYDARRELAGQFAIVMPGQEEPDDAVIRACANRIESI